MTKTQNLGRSPPINTLYIVLQIHTNTTYRIKMWIESGFGLKWKLIKKEKLKQWIIIIFVVKNL